MDCFRHETLYNTPALVGFRERIRAGFVMAVNEIIVKESRVTTRHAPENEIVRAKQTAKESYENGDSGTPMIHATVS